MASVRIDFDEEGNARPADIAYSVDQLRALVKQMQEIDDDIKLLRERKKRIINDYVTEHNLPKKEVNEAIKMLKSDIDPSLTQDIYKDIADLVDV